MRPGHRGRRSSTCPTTALSVDFRLIATNIDNVVAAHIHTGAHGCERAGRRVPRTGRAARGRRAADRRPVDGHVHGGEPDRARLRASRSSVLIEAMRTGNAYVNVHTNDGVAPTNTGPGDFPGGEIRAQIIEE